MVAKKLLFRSQAREAILSGATQLADAVRVTLGPKSKSVLIYRRWANPIVCNDGVTIAKETELEDPAEDLGARVLRQAAERTGEAVGDGTSTATVLAHAILAEGIRNVVAGASAIDLKRGLDRGVGVALASLRSQARPVATRLERAQVAAISAHNDPAVGEQVAEAMDRIGVDGVITVEESRTTETTIEVVEGMQFDRGWLSPYFVSSADRMEAVLDDAWILLCDRRIGNLAELLPLLEQLAKSGRPALFIAEDIDGEALATLIVNQLRAVLRSCAVRAPGFGDRRKELLQDIATLTGAEMISEERGMRLEQAGLAQLGRVRRAVVSREATTLIGGAGDRAVIQTRIAHLRAQLELVTGDYEREQLRACIARLAGGVAVVRVGAPSEAEMRARKDAFDDAIAATRAAIAEGIVPGGGLALLRVVPAIAAAVEQSSGDERTGLQILLRALEAPARTIAANSAVDGGVVVDRLLAGGQSVGFDAARGVYVDLFEAGIIDPTKVVRVALENAVSVAGLLLLTEATMTEIAEKAPRPESVDAGQG
ncbi:MAG: chaperonin GroEL [Betaproteobacteria bacterium]